MLGKPLALAMTVLLCGAAFAGCIGKNKNDSGSDPTLTSSNSSFLNETDTPDGRGEISAFKETNATEKGKGGMEHDHDYWAGETRKIIYQDDIGLLPLPLTPEGNYAPGTAIADFNLPAPALVYEGTAQLELLFHNVNVLFTTDPAVPTDTSGVTHPHVNILVDYITAADDPGEWHQAGQVTPETPLIIPVKPLEADMPHQVASLWLFRIYTAEPNFFEFNLTLTAVKGYDVVKWPPHPDLYAKGPERVIYDGPWETKLNGPEKFFLTGSDTNWFFPEKVISYGTDKLIVDVTDLKFSKTSPTTPDPPAYYLDFYNASFAPKIGNGATSGGSAFDEASDGANFHFEMPVSEYGYDSPYQTHSRWGFRMLPQYQDQAEPPVILVDWRSLLCFDCFESTISYNLKIVAVGHSTGEEGIDMMDPALRPEANETASGGGERASGPVLPAGPAGPPPAGPVASVASRATGGA